MTDTSPITRAYQAETLDVRDGERAVVARINTASVDRYRTVIDPAGIDLSAYQKNPVVLYEHGRDPKRGSLPIGRNLWVKHDRGSRSLIAKTVFGTDEFADTLFRLYQDGTLRAFSVNILPKSASPPTKDERAANDTLNACEMIYRESELAEYSAVAVPGNAEALAIAVSRGLWVPDDIRETLEASRSTMTDDGGDDATQDTERMLTEDDLRKLGEQSQESFDGSALRCVERHALGHCPRCGEPGMPSFRSDPRVSQCDKGHEFEPSRAIECPYKEPERTAPVIELPPLSGRTFAELVASYTIMIRAANERMVRSVNEHRDLRKGRV